MKEDHKANAILSVPGTRLGDPFRLHISSVDSVYRRTEGPPIVRGTAHLGVFSCDHPAGAGKDYWLVVSLDLQPFVTENICTPKAEHTQRVLSREGATPGASIDWIAPITFEVQWKNRRGGRLPRLYRIISRATKETMREFVRKYGDPNNDGFWFFSRLLPRKKRAAVRTPREGGWLQVWWNI